MKKTLIWLLVFAMLLLAGCQKAEPPETTVPVSSETTAEPTETTTAKPEPETEAPTEPVTEPPEVPLTKLAESRYSLSGLSVGGSLCTVSERVGEEKIILSSYDLAEKKLLGKISLGIETGEAVAWPGGVAIFDWGTMSLDRYTPELKKIDTVEGPELSYGRACSDGYFYGVGKDGTVVRMDMSTKEKEKFDMPEGFIPQLVTSVHGSVGLVEGNDAAEEYQRKMLNFETGEVIDCDMTETPNYSDSFYQMYTGRNETCFRGSGSQELYVIPGDDFYSITSSETGLLLYEKEQGLVFCDLEKGLSWKQAAEDCWCGAITPEGIVYIEEAETSSLCLWDYELTEPAELAAEKKTLEDLNRENKALAEQIYERTGMKIYYGEAGTGFNEEEDTCYLSETVTDPLTIYLGLCQIDTWSSEYPDGMFREMLAFGRDRIEIYLCGKLSPNGEGTVSDALAFASGQMNRWAVVVDITHVDQPAIFRSTMVHEFMHVMEDRILQCELDTGMFYGAYWEAFAGPEMYYNSYDVINEIPYDHTASSEESPEEILFIDPYSRTFPIEDRARVLEYLYLGEESSFEKNLQEGVLGEKARYLCGLIRECFPSCQIEGKLPWEKLVEDNSFDDYREALRTFEVPAVG